MNGLRESLREKVKAANAAGFKVRWIMAMSIRPSRSGWFNMVHREMYTIQDKSGRIYCQCSSIDDPGPWSDGGPVEGLWRSFFAQQEIDVLRNTT